MDGVSQRWLGWRLELWCPTSRRATFAGRVFGFWFYNDDPAADQAPVCALPSAQLRAGLTTHGWVERAVPSEIGSVLAIEFARHDMVLTLTPRDVATSGTAQCVLSLLATVGR